MSFQQDTESLHGFIDETNESLENIESSFVRLENDPTNTDIIDEIFRPVHSMKGNSGFFNLTNINKFSHQLENILDFIRNGELSVNKEIIDILFTGIDFLQKMLDRALEDPYDVKLRSDEKTFLKQKVATIRPVKVVGSIQSIRDLQDYLDEASDIGIDIEKNRLICDILAQIENANKNIRILIEEQKTVRKYILYSSEKEYEYNGVKCTEFLKPFGSILEKITDKIPTDDDLVNEFLGGLKEIEKILTQDEVTGGIFTRLRNLSTFLGDDLLISTSEFCNDIIELTNEIISRLDETSTIDLPVQRVGEILQGQNIITEDQVLDALSKQKKIGEILVKDSTISEEALQEALNIQNEQKIKENQITQTTREKSKTIRINQSRLDEFANSVGELFINIDAFTYLKNVLEEGNIEVNLVSRFADTISSMDDRVTKLQENIMNIRKVSVKKLFRRFPRIIRELSASLKKDINLTIIGEETVIDKDLIEKIENPLVHILRNAVDHGIESPEERLEHGKNSQGNIELKAWVDEYYVHLSIKDDGGGIDPAKMKEIALKDNKIKSTELEQLTDKELINLVFKAGFSSAEKISDVSGRGVGMDVVISNIKACNGTVELDSIVNEGTFCNIKIPLTKTLVTKDALIVESAGQLFAIPSDDITTTLDTNVKFGSILEHDKVISYNDIIHNVIALDNFFYLKSGSHGQVREDQMLVVSSENCAAILVDKMYNHQKIVVKNFEKTFKQLKNIPGVSGYTILGNEDIVLLVDVEQVVKASFK